MKKIFLIILAAAFSQIGFSQQAADAIRYSYLNPGGTARFISTGGAFTALGADFGSISTNPAGLAMFRSNDFSVSPGLRFASANTTIGSSQNANEEFKSNFNFNNFGLVFSTQPRSQHWKTFNFGIGMNKIANFHQAIYYEGQHAGSIMNGYFSEANSAFATGGGEEDLDPFGAKMAWDANAIYFQDSALSYDFTDFETANIDHAQALISTGNINEMVVAFAGNYDDKLNVGVTIGVPFIKYQLETTYDEKDPNDAVPYFEKLTRTEFLRTNGLGINLKMGLSYKVSQNVRLGVAFHTPTFLSLTDNFENTFNYSYTDGSGTVESGDKFSPNGTFDYKLRTPWRAMIGGAFVIQKFNYISADIEFVDYSANNFNLTSDLASTDNQSFERELNRQIRNDYQRATNFRLGGQAAFGVVRLRAGLNLLGNYRKSESGFNTTYSGGLGILKEKFYIDLGYRRATGTTSVSPYFDPELSEKDQLTAEAKSVANDFVLTLGFKF